MKFLAVLLMALALAGPACASPGAHGPNGEHLDGEAHAEVAGGAPRMETFTELFELVGQLAGGEFSVMIDRYDSNEPVLNGKLEVQYKNIKALAKFHPDMGDYAIDDPALIAALSAPGKHALLFTFIAGDDSDLLEGTLEVAAHADDDAHAHRPWWHWLAGAAALALAAVMIILAAAALKRRRQRKEAA